MKLQATDLNYFRGKSHLELRWHAKSFFVLIRYLKNGNIDDISVWKSKGLSDESIKPPTAFNKSLAPAINHINTKSRVKFILTCLKQ